MIVDGSGTEPSIELFTLNGFGKVAGGVGAAAAGDKYTGVSVCCI